MVEQVTTGVDAKSALVSFASHAQRRDNRPCAPRYETSPGVIEQD